MLLQNRFQKLKFVFVIAVTLISLKFWSFQLLDDSLTKMIEFIAIISLLTLVVYNLSVLKKPNLKFKINVLLFLLLPFLSVIGAKIYHDQDYSLSLLVTRFFLFWLFYYVLHIFNTPPEKIIKLLVFVGCTWIFLVVIQQFTYPEYYFYTKSDNKNLYRAGIYRYGVVGVQYGIFVLFYFFYKYFNTKKIYTLIYVALAIIGLYYTGTRQIMFAAFASLFVAILLVKGVSKWKYLLFFTIMIFLLVSSFAYLFDELLEMTTAQVSDEDYIRILSANFYLYEYWPHWTAKLIGNGPAHGDSAYGQEIEQLQSYLTFYRADIGIIGVFNSLGIFFVLNILWVNLKGIFFKIKNQKDKYLKVFFFYFTSLLLLSTSYDTMAVIPFFCFIFYLIDKSVEQDNELILAFRQEKNTEEITV
jgi:hypothetical protein